MNILSKSNKNLNEVEYEDELERNLKNKTIRLINPSAAGDISTQMSDTLAALL